MSDERVFVISLRTAATIKTRFGNTIRKKVPLRLSGGHPHLAYYRANKAMFVVRLAGRGAGAMPRKRTTPIVQRPIDVTDLVEKNEDAATEPEKIPEPVPPSNERKVFTSERVFSESQLSKMTREELESVAEELEVEVKARDTKSVIVERLLTSEG